MLKESLDGMDRPTFDLMVSLTICPPETAVASTKGCACKGGFNNWELQDGCRVHGDLFKEWKESNA